MANQLDTVNFTNMRALMKALAMAMNLIDPDIENHHERTAYLTLFVAREMGVPEEDAVQAMYAALLHDIGSILVEVPQSVTEIEQNAREVALVGSRMLEDLPGFGDITSIIGYCQCSWTEALACFESDGATDDCLRLGRLASIVHLADVVSLMVRSDEHVLNQSKRICEVVRRCRGTEFSPEACDAFLRLADTEYIWMDLAHNPLFLTYFTGDIASVSLEQTVQLTSFMSRIIDFRSPFTAMHSSGVAAAATELARLAGFDEATIQQVNVAGNLHDIGKLAVPRSILEKPGKLNDEEFGIIKEHPYYTALVLLEVDGFESIGKWASRHHEKLNGKGYPFHLGKESLSAEARIMAVADIFSAITEQRPYRAGMTRDRATEVLYEDVRSGAICGDVVDLLIDNYELVDAARDRASRRAGKRYFDSL